MPAVALLGGQAFITAGNVLAAGTSYADCDAAQSFPTDLAAVTSGDATFTFRSNCTINLNGPIIIQNTLTTTITVDGNGLILDGGNRASISSTSVVRRAAPTP